MTALERYKELRQKQDFLQEQFLELKNEAATTCRIEINNWMSSHGGDTEGRDGSSSVGWWLYRKVDKLREELGVVNWQVEQVFKDALLENDLR